MIPISILYKQKVTENCYRIMENTNSLQLEDRINYSLSWTTVSLGWHLSDLFSETPP